MTHFIGEIQGNRGEASRLGSKDSGIWSNVRGWEFGVTVYLKEIDGEDTATIYINSGSNGRHPSKCIGTFTKKDLIEE